MSISDGKRFDFISLNLHKVEIKNDVLNFLEKKKIKN